MHKMNLVSRNEQVSQHARNFLPKRNSLQFFSCQKKGKNLVTSSLREQSPTPAKQVPLDVLGVCGCAGVRVCGCVGEFC